MIWKMILQLFLTVLLLAVTTIASSAAEYNEENLEKYMVIPDSSDCENAITLKMIVTASNTGKAFTVYDDIKIAMFRKGKNENNCRIIMFKYKKDNLIERQIYQCTFQYPFGG